MWIVCGLSIPCKDRTLFPTIVILKGTIKPTGKEDNLNVYLVDCCKFLIAHRVLLQGDVPVVVLPLGQDEVPSLVSEDGRPLGPGGAAVRVNDTLARHKESGAAGQEREEE